MALYALLIAPPSGLTLFTLRWFSGAHAYIDDTQDEAAPAEVILTLASLFAARGAILGLGAGMLIGGTYVHARRPHN